uniref:Uncharacterized protein n=1 Tax=Lepeophtheirus salmonis TaxID=72036 RepID=A0A0K2T4Q9_LEPSM
MKQSLTSSHI